MTWRILRVEADAGAFHSADVDAQRSVTFVTVAAPTLVLGSGQSADAVDARVAALLGVQVVRRRSGGGAVLLMPGEFVWADVVVPRGDPLWSDDVAGAMVWVGEWWRRSLGGAGEVHRGPLLSGEWSRQVCWAGVGTGEVIASASRKLVGISQRRTRDTARFQTMCHLRARPELVAALVASPRPSPVDVAALFGVVAASADDVAAALVAHLPD